MKILATIFALVLGFTTAAFATTIERTSVKLPGEATWVPTLSVNGVKVIPDEAGGTEGLSKNCAASERCATAWAESRYGSVEARRVMGGGVEYLGDLNGNGLRDLEEFDAEAPDW